MTFDPAKWTASFKLSETVIRLSLQLMDSKTKAFQGGKFSTRVHIQRYQLMFSCMGATKRCEPTILGWPNNSDLPPQKLPMQCLGFASQDK